MLWLKEKDWKTYHDKIIMGTSFVDTHFQNVQWVHLVEGGLTINIITANFLWTCTNVQISPYFLKLNTKISKAIFNIYTLSVHFLNGYVFVLMIWNGCTLLSGVEGLKKCSLCTLLKMVENYGWLVNNTLMYFKPKDSLENKTCYRPIVLF